MSNLLKNAILAIAATGAVATALPAAAVEVTTARAATFATFETAADQSGTEWNQSRRGRENRRWAQQRRDDRRYDNDRRDYRPRCEKKSGTTGLIVGGAAGALLGREIDGGRDRTLGTVLGAAGGALLGREIEGTGVKCR